MDTEIRKENKIQTGCEQFTSPEEISALSKYLKKQRKALDSSIYLEKDNLGVPGWRSGSLKNIESLSDKLQVLDQKGEGDVSKLVSEKEWIASGKDLEKLGNKKENIEGVLKDNTLSKDKLGLPEGNKDIETLGTTRLDLEDPREATLSKLIERIGSGSEKTPSLSKTRLDIDPLNKISLAKEILGVSGNTKEDLKLENSRLDLGEIEEAKLEDTLVKSKESQNKETSKLGDKRVDIQVKENEALSNFQESLVGNKPKDPKLGNKSEHISGNIKDQALDQGIIKVSKGENEEVSLGKDALEIEGIIKDPKLGGKSLSVEGQIKDPGLGKYLGKVEGDLDETALSNNLETFNPGEEEELQSHLEKLKDKGVDPELGNKRESLLGKPSDISLNTKGAESIATDISELDKLSNVKEQVFGDSEDDLSSLSEELEKVQSGDKEVELGNFLEGINSSIEDPSLSDHLEKTGKKDVDSLEDTLLSIDVDDNLSLGNHVEEIRPDSVGDVDLSSWLEEIGSPVEEDIELETALEDIEGEISDNTGLSDNLETIDGETSSDIELSENLEAIDGEIPTSTELSGELEKLENEIEDVELGDHLENLEAPVSEDIKLSENLEKPENEVGDVELGSYLDSVKEDGLSDVELGDRLEKIDNSELEEELSDTREIVTPDDTQRAQEGHQQFEKIEDGSLYDSVLAVKDISESSPEVDLGQTSSSISKNLGGDIEDDLGKHLEKRKSETPEPEVQIAEDKETIVNRFNHNPIIGMWQVAPPDETEKVINKPDDPNIEELKEIIESRDDVDAYYKKILHFADHKDINSGWAAKVVGLMNSYLSGEITKEKAEEFETQILRTIVKDRGNIQMARYKLNSSWYSMINANTYLRWIAEKSVSWIKGSSGSWIYGNSPYGKGNARLEALDTMLKMLVWIRRDGEIASHANRDRLPGKDEGLLSDIVAGGDTRSLALTAATKLYNSISKGFDSNRTIDTSQPLNRPEKGEETVGFEYGNGRSSTSIHDPNNKNLTNPYKFSKKNGLLKNAVKAFKGALTGYEANKGYNFSENYISSWGMTTTLSELCGIKASEVNSVEDLQDAIRNSLYMNHPDKFTTTKTNAGNGKVFTLDSNSYWEIIFDPYVGPDNNYISYLPSIDEINIWNMLHFGVYTGYSRWIPFISFDLSKSKITSKNIALFDGEISYPVSMEFTNELRLTIVDDQYKSWRTYFERCADASIYNSEPHKAEYYGYSKDGTYKPRAKTGLTAIDKSFVCAAPYKNITFRCVIYCMTPQKETISKYDLLLILRDFSEERSGDIEGGANDLTLTFSIVGENPDYTVKLSDQIKKEEPIGDFEKLQTPVDLSGTSGGLTLLQA